MKILVAGGFYDSKEDPKLYSKTVDFTKTLGEEIIKQGHTLINACVSEFDAVLAESAFNALKYTNDDSKDRIIGYVADGKKPSHNFGKIRSSELKDWELGGSNLRIPEPIDIADVVIIVCGFNGVQRAANWARIAKKPILPLVKFGGSSKEIYREEKINLKKSMSSNISIGDFEDLSQTTIEDIDLAKTVLSLAERINLSKNAFVIMSFNDDPNLEDAFDSFKTVCNRFSPKYNCQRMDEITDIKKITPEMLNNIRNSAFVIVDLTFERPNVYYELGYADALEKPIIVTARKETIIHFDAKDFPILFWESQKVLKQELLKRVQQIATNQGRVLKIQ
ncbi:hypothetical protein [Mariniflexile sp. AS56]|uniref:hypothetical protein n=1 Tax=Mariniflexile sp. AS56 TaxID=3063957 RepID=UPI0026F18189|nr:hypothetical protein [Mariniflexile sp. AS56]MDO7173835.1 hypothetical protein [Mariniflexile sp. AS56]